MRYLSVIILFTINSNLLSQNQTYSRSEASEVMVNNFDLSNLESKTAKANTPIYLTEEWSKYKITLRTGEVLKEIVGKYDIRNNSFEIQHKGDIKELSGMKISKFTPSNLEDIEAGNNTLVNVTSFDTNSSGIYKNGFFEEIYVGDEKGVYKYHFIKVIPPNYNMSLNTGSKTEKYVRATKMVVFDHGDFTKLESSKKKNLKLFEGSSDKVSAYIKKNKLSFKSEHDLKKIFMFYDELENQM